MAVCESNISNVKEPGKDSDYSRDRDQNYKGGLATTKRTTTKEMIFFILLIALPVVIESKVDSFWYRRGLSDPKLLTMILRAVIMGVLVWLAPVQYWQSILLTVSAHTFLFPIYHNVVVLHRHWSYVGRTSAFDRAEQWLRDKITTPGVLFLKLALFASAIKFYFNPDIY
jgi:hypothetical protein